MQVDRVVAQSFCLDGGRRLGQRRFVRRRAPRLGAVVAARVAASSIKQSQRERSMFKKVAFTMYPVKDSARARSFYEGTLGLTPGSKSENGVWTEYDLPGGGCLALFAGGDLEPSANSGGVAFEVEDLDALNARLKAEGVQFKAEMIHSPVCRMSVILDSEGNSIILHELKKR
jgi:predicted enzyme related to lactoylglutathione lyase